MTFDELLVLVSSKNNVPRLCADSRLVKAGDLFVAIKGTIYDGHDFVDQALANGAKYIVCQRPDARNSISSIEHRASSIETITVADSAKAAAILAQAARGNPASQLTNLAITGTNGKTTVAYLVRSVMQAAVKSAALSAQLFTIRSRAAPKQS